MTYLKYIDARAINNNTFESAEELKKYKARTVEAVGYFVKEDDVAVFIAMQRVGAQFRKVLFVPKDQIVERDDNFKADEEVKNDAMLNATANVSMDKLKYPEAVVTCGFRVSKNMLAMERNEDDKFRTVVIFPTEK
jgi:hypothetical protein